MTPFPQPLEAPDETLDAICGGAVRVLQPARGYRFNLDPVLLAHFVEEEGIRGPLIDLGTGSGIIPLILARKFRRSELLGLELQPRLYSLARRSVALNGCEARVSMALGDLREVRRLFARESFQHVVSNPPYRAAGDGRRSPDSERAVARHEIHCDLNDLILAASWLLKERATLSLIYPTARMAEVLTALRARLLEPRRVRFVHARAGRPAKRVLISAVKGGATGLEVQPPLVVHPDDVPGFTTEVREMLE